MFLTLRLEGYRGFGEKLCRSDDPRIIKE